MMTLPNGKPIDLGMLMAEKEAASTTWLPNRHLLEPQNGCGSLNWYEEVDAWVEGNTLFLLCLDEKQRISLYQIE
ncbi:MAG TPA: hypothetical protein VGD98_12205 [Ktedonobacteraceae bacterium]